MGYPFGVYLKMAMNHLEFHRSKEKEGEGAIAMNPTLLQFDLKT
jgi:hypothetical protein